MPPLIEMKMEQSQIVNLGFINSETPTSSSGCSLFTSATIVSGGEYRRATFPYGNT